MLGLKLATDPRWVNIVEKNLEEILTDHAYCEQKAATNAISMIVRFPAYPDMVQIMSEVAIEEMEHFAMVHKLITDRNLTFGKERRDPYVKDLMGFMIGGDEEQQFIDRMLVSAMIEARSCERFRILSEELEDEELRVFYRSLMESEARHYTTFIKLAKKHAVKIDVDKRWNDFLDYEANVMKKYGNTETIHG